MKVAVTGASGFLGAHVLQALRARGGLQLVTASRGPLPVERIQPGARHVCFDLGTVEPATGLRSARATGCPDPSCLVGIAELQICHHLEQQACRQQYAFLSGLVKAGSALTDLYRHVLRIRYAVRPVERGPADPTEQRIRCRQGRVAWPA